MINHLNILLKKIGLFDSLKILKDKYFENPLETEYKKKLLRFYSQFIVPGNLCFDIGASYGNRTSTYLELGAKVITFEPQSNVAKFLEKKFGKKILLIKKAVGSKDEFRTMYVNKNTALSSLSKDWINKVSKSKRFSNQKWDKKIEVEVVTLDAIIEKYGVPDFCKIDVEGFEFEVLKGLTRPIRQLSFEFTIPEFIQQAINCIEYLNLLGTIVCNFSSGESLELGLEDWISPVDFIKLFKTLQTKNIIDGDIYIRFLNAN